MTHPANWYPDPNGRHELRYWDGERWTDHVSNDGVTGMDPVVLGASPQQAEQPSGLDGFEAATTIGNEGDPEKLHHQIAGTDHRGAGIQQRVEGGGGTLFTEPVLVVNQKVKLIELHNQYSVFDQDGNQIGWVEQSGQSTAKKIARLVSSMDQFLTHHLDVHDASGRIVLKLTRPRKMVKSSVIVSDGEGTEIGRIIQKNVFGKIDFALEAGGHTHGHIKGENWRAWNWRIEDHTGTEVARITKTFEGLAKTMFTTADNYVVQVHAQLGEPLRSLVVASALSIDTALKQDDRGFN